MNRTDQTIVKIYPNPAKDLLTIEINHANRQAVSLVSGNGKKILVSSDLIDGKLQLNTGNFARGLYLLMIERDGQIVYKEKVVLQ